MTCCVLYLVPAGGTPPADVDGLLLPILPLVGTYVSRLNAAATRFSPTPIDASPINAVFNWRREM